MNLKKDENLDIVIKTDLLHLCLLAEGVVLQMLCWRKPAKFILKRMPYNVPGGRYQNVSCTTLLVENGTSQPLYIYIRLGNAAMNGI